MEVCKSPVSLPQNGIMLKVHPSPKLSVELCFSSAKPACLPLSGIDCSREHSPMTLLLGESASGEMHLWRLGTPPLIAFCLFNRKALSSPSDLFILLSLNCFWGISRIPEHLPHVQMCGGCTGWVYCGGCGTAWIWLLQPLVEI